MNTHKKTIKKSFNFWTFFHQYRTKIALLSFFIILPITLILIAYLGPLGESKSITFDTNPNGEATQISSFDDLNDLKDLNITLKWTNLRNPIYNKGELLTTGFYRFNLTYDVLNNKNISNVNVQIALKPLYGTSQDLSSMTSIRNTSDGTNIEVVHNVIYPFSPLWFITINEPTVYLKITYTESFSGNIDPINVTIYAQYSLKDKLPLTVE